MKLVILYLAIFWIGSTFAGLVTFPIFKSSIYLKRILFLCYTAPQYDPDCNPRLDMYCNPPLQTQAPQQQPNYQMPIFAF